MKNAKFLFGSERYENVLDIFGLWGVLVLAYVLSGCGMTIGHGANLIGKSNNGHSAASVPTPTPQKLENSDEKNMKEPLSNQKMVGSQTEKWGSNEIVFRVEMEAVEIKLPCAEGKIDEPLVLDADGGFSFEGTYTRAGRGPMRFDPNYNQRPVIYSGKIDGDNLNLKISTVDTKELIGEYTLKRGFTGNIEDCPIV